MSPIRRASRFVAREMAEGVTTQACIEQALQDRSEDAPDIGSTRFAARDLFPDHLPLDFSLSPLSSASRPSPAKRSLSPSSLASRPSRSKRSSLAPRRTPFQPPEPHSINDLLRQHGRERLYVHPLCWTSRQLHLLECHFVANEAIGHAVNKEVQKRKDEVAQAKNAVGGPTDTQSGATLLADEEAIKQRQATGIKIRETFAWLRRSSKGAISDVQDLLEHQGFSRLDSPLYLSFGGRKVKELEPGAIFIAPGCTNPSVAFVKLGTIGNLRFDCIAKPGSHAKPIDKHRYKDWHQLKPQNPIEDPYIVAILVALAQGQRGQVHTRDEILSLETASPVGNSPAKQDLQQFTVSEATSLKPQQNSSKVHVLALSLPSLYMYTAQIPASLLDRLDYPSRYFPAEPFHVSRFEIPLRGLTRTPLMRHALSLMRG